MSGQHLDDAFAARGAKAARTFTRREANLLVSALHLVRVRMEETPGIDHSDTESLITSIINNGWETQS